MFYRGIASKPVMHSPIAAVDSSHRQAELINHMFTVWRENALDAYTQPSTRPFAYRFPRPINDGVCRPCFCYVAILFICYVT